MPTGICNCCNKPIRSIYHKDKCKKRLIKKGEILQFRCDYCKNIIRGVYAQSPVEWTDVDGNRKIDKWFCSEECLIQFADKYEENYNMKRLCEICNKEIPEHKRENAKTCSIWCQIARERKLSKIKREEKMEKRRMIFR